MPCRGPVWLPSYTLPLPSLDPIQIVATCFHLLESRLTPSPRDAIFVQFDLHEICGRLLALQRLRRLGKESQMTFSFGAQTPGFSQGDSGDPVRLLFSRLCARTGV